jgi:hypothetical protein
MNSNLFRQNPLDTLPVPDVPYIIVDTNSYINEIKNKTDDIIRFLKICSFKTCKIVFTPTNDIEIMKFIESFNGDFATYYLQGKSYILKSKSVEAIFSSEINEERNAHFKLGTGMELQDKMALSSIWFHYSVSDRHSKSMTLTQILDILEVYHIKNKIFIGYDFGVLGEFLYDMHKTNAQIPNYKTFWVEFCYLTMAYGSTRPTLENLCQSLDDRVTLINKAVVELKYHSLKTVSNQGTMDLMYHLSYFVILITGSYDNIAWMLNYIFELGFSLQNVTRNQVGLQKKGQKVKSSLPYYKALQSKSPQIFDYLTRPEISGFIDFIYPLREAVQHRSFIKPLTAVKSGNPLTKLIIWFPDELTDELNLNFNPLDFGLDSDISDLMGSSYYNIYLFQQKVHKTFTEIINNIVGMVDLKEVLSLTNEQIAGISDAKDKYNKDPWGGLKIRNSIVY